MILRTAHNGDRTVRTANEFGSTAVPPPRWRSGYPAFSGVQVSMERAVGLPAVLAAIRLISEVVASFELCVYRGSGETKRRAEAAWQNRLLQRPTLDGTRFDWISDLMAGVEGYGNAFAQKVRANGRVVEMPILDPDHVRIRRDGGQKVFDVHFADKRGTLKGLTSSDILHVRGFTLNGQLSGLSPIGVHRHAIGNALAQEEFAGRFFANDATPPFVIRVPGNVSKQKALDALEIFESTHSGLENKHRPAMLSNGADIAKLGVSLQDALFIDAMHYGVSEVARIWRIPSSLLELGIYRTQPDVEQDGLRFLTFSLLQRLKRFRDALAADQDLFANSPLYVDFDTSSLLAVDAATLNTIEHDQIQDGRKLVDEIRAEHGQDPLPPVPADWTQEPGKVPQIVPVGGAPNPEMNTNVPDAAAASAAD